jgi:hypothetical protein
MQEDQKNEPFLGLTEHQRAAIKEADDKLMGFAERTLVPTLGRILMSVVVFGGGIILSLLLKEWMWFARSGALVTAVQLFWVVKRITGSLYGFVDPSELRKQIEAIPPSTLKAVGEQLVYKLQRSATIITAVHRQSIIPKQSASDAAAQLVEAWILLVSTLIWGFGDLVGKIMG